MGDVGRDHAGRAAANGSRWLARPGAGRGTVRGRTMEFGLIGVPSSAGAHGPGQEKSPSALRKAGSLGALREAGLEVEDLGDLAVPRFSPYGANRSRQDQSHGVKVARSF